MRKLQTRFRPVDLAREYGLSTQAIRNYEAAGILPGADRSTTGYRTYTAVHVQALRTFLALLPAHGHPGATAIMQAVHRDDTAGALQVIDRSHAQLLDDRETLQAVEAALHRLTPVQQQRPGDTFVGPLAARLGLRPATLRTWEREGLIRPRRDPQTGYRVYSAADVRDAQLIHQLRRGGYRLRQITPVLTQIRTAGSRTAAEALLSDWQTRLNTRGRAMLSAAAELNAYLSTHG